MQRTSKVGKVVRKRDEGNMRRTFIFETNESSEIM